MESIFYNESVELLVYCFEVLAKPCTNKQYPTQAVIYFGTVYDNASDEWQLLTLVL